MKLIKKKQRVLVLFSTLIVTVVILSTLLGYSLYVEWKEDSFASGYRHMIYKLTGDIFRETINISNIRVEPGPRRPRSAGGSPIPMVCGDIKNSSMKTIASLRFEVSFSREDGTVVYRDWFYPLGEKDLPVSPFFSGAAREGEPLPAGERKTFKYVMKNCPAEVSDSIFADSAFAKGEGEKLNVNVTVAGVRVK